MPSNVLFDIFVPQSIRIVITCDNYRVGEISRSMALRQDLLNLRDFPLPLSITHELGGDSHVVVIAMAFESTPSRDKIHLAAVAPCLSSSSSSRSAFSGALDRRRRHFLVVDNDDNDRIHSRRSPLEHTLP